MEGHVSTNPIARMPRPSPTRREAVLSPAQIGMLLDSLARDDPFRDLLVVLRETGCRPGEAIRLTASQVDINVGTWVVPNKTRRATGEATRVVYLSDVALEICRAAVESQPKGPIFRNTKGRPWTRNAIVLRMRRSGQRLGFGVESVAYSLRHDFATTALERGVPPATVAELLGHRSLAMVMRVYSRLASRTEHLRSAAKQVREVNDSTS